jgi:hypothetical protein
MGADLYISPLFDPQHKEWESQFNLAVAERDRLTEGTPEYALAQKRVEYCYSQMYEKGYFRDSYNDSDLLWKFDLSWWEDVIPMLEEESRLSPPKAAQLLAMLKQKEVAFCDNLASLPAPAKRYFTKKYAQLQKFLKQAIELGVPIECSL